jgi:hypothetical protein
MNWEDRETTTTKAQSIQALMDGIHKNVSNDELEAYAKAEGIPFQRQGNKATPAPTPAPPAPVDDYEDSDDDYEESYEESYYDSSC